MTSSAQLSVSIQTSSRSSSTIYASGAASIPSAQVHFCLPPVRPLRGDRRCGRSLAGPCKSCGQLPHLTVRNFCITLNASIQPLRGLQEVSPETCYTSLHNSEKARKRPAWHHKRDTTMISFPVMLFRLALALVLGGVVGFERERSAHTAGLRTNALVAMGSALSC